MQALSLSPFFCVFVFQFFCFLVPLPLSPKYSFIIPTKAINNYIRESVPNILAIDRDDYEILLYPNAAGEESWPKTRQIPTGPEGPASKRSRAIQDAAGEILIFLDDDAWPRGDYLSHLDKVFADDLVVAVGGPAITPPTDTFWQHVSGAVFLSRWSGGYPERYVPVGKPRDVDDWPSVNLIVRRETFAQVGGFDSEYWPGEDTKFCIDLLSQTGKKVRYDPNVQVWHHRRAGYRSHLKQVGGYGLHRGFFARRYPSTSRRPGYFIPSAFVLFLLLGLIASLAWPALFPFYLLGLGIYGIALLLAAIDIYRFGKSALVIFPALYYIVSTHIFYGLKFLQGFLFTRELKSKLR